MRAQHHEIRRYPGRRAQEVVLGDLAASCRLKVVESVSGFAKLRCGLSWWSFGEMITVHVTEADDALVVDVLSICSLVPQVEDWGKNRKNVRKFFETLEHALGVGEFHVVPICPRCGYAMMVSDTSVCPECGAAIGPITAGDTFRQKLRSLWPVIAITTALQIAMLVVVNAIAGFGRWGLLFIVVGTIVVVGVNLVMLVCMLLLACYWKPNG